ncbi:LacI family transcriptional regulator [Luteipulveratus mongoliensis]|uniref:LacI family transcriptional regulator n=2 Tax=Luteipulveratus mongoliensis TaxID=571913 RepID=A0A0K1JEF2_9MICO|nr:LacI family transcriptional regulator [Luteipulveratus mongoliensis]
MQDVARLAGVSAQTVSRVLRGHVNVSDRTRSQVMSAVEQLGYRRNHAASVLSSGRSRTIGAVMWSTVQYSGLLISHGMEQAARESGYTVSTVSVTSLAAHALESALATLIEQAVEGIVLAIPINEPDRRVADLLARVPSVSVDGAISSTTQMVMVDQELIGRLATQHLLDLGHDNVWHVSGDDKWNEASLRTAGWQRTVEAAGRTPAPLLHGDWTPQSGYEAGQLLARIPDATAVFVSSDEMAFGVMRALEDAGLRIPEDVSVVGVDDISLAPFSRPALTTVAQPLLGVGASAVRHLLAQITKEPIEETPLVPELIVRASTAPPRKPLVE